MDHARKLRCSLLGTGSLVIQCADELRSRGHVIVGIASPDARVAVWARDHGVRSAQVVAWLRQQGWTQAVSMAGGIDAWAREVDARVGSY